MIVAQRHARRRGSLGLVLVLTLGALLAAAVMASGAKIQPAARETRRTLPSDQAWAAAEGGVAWAQARWEADVDYAGRQALRVGEADVRIEVAAAGPELRDVSVVARVQDPAGRPGEWITRRVQARLARVDGVLRVIDWEDL